MRGRKRIGRKERRQRKKGRKKRKKVGTEIGERKGRKWERIEMGMRRFLGYRKKRE